MSTSIPDPATALELEKLRGDLGVGVAEIKGSLALLVQRSEQTDQLLIQHRDQLNDHEKRLGELEQGAAAGADHETRLSGVERRTWWFTGGAAAIGSVAGVAAAFLAK